MEWVLCPWVGEIHEIVSESMNWDGGICKSCSIIDGNRRDTMGILSAEKNLTRGGTLPHKIAPALGILPTNLLMHFTIPLVGSGVDPWCKPVLQGLVRPKVPYFLMFSSYVPGNCSWSGSASDEESSSSSSSSPSCSCSF